MTENQEGLMNKVTKMSVEIDKQKYRISKLKMRKGKDDIGFKSCKWCNKEYDEKTNFNWSCRTHRGDYSEVDDIWWCCGKKGKNQPGCKK